MPKGTSPASSSYSVLPLPTGTNFPYPTGSANPFPTATGTGTAYYSQPTASYNKGEIEFAAKQKREAFQGPRRNNFPHYYPYTAKQLLQRMRIKVRSDADALEASLKDTPPAERQDILWQRGIIRLRR